MEPATVFSPMKKLLKQLRATSVQAAVSLLLIFLSAVGVLAVPFYYLFPDATFAKDPPPVEPTTPTFELIFIGFLFWIFFLSVLISTLSFFGLFLSREVTPRSFSSKKIVHLAQEYGKVMLLIFWITAILGLLVFSNAIAYHFLCNITPQLILVVSLLILIFIKVYILPKKIGMRSYIYLKKNGFKKFARWSIKNCQILASTFFVYIGKKLYYTTYGNSLLVFCLIALILSLWNIPYFLFTGTIYFSPSLLFLYPFFFAIYSLLGISWGLFSCYCLQGKLDCQTREKSGPSGSSGNPMNDGLPEMKTEKSDNQETKK